MTRTTTMMTRDDIAALDDVELVKLLTIDSEQHSADVLSWATEEATQRGVPIDAAFIPQEPVGGTSHVRKIRRTFWEGRTTKDLVGSCCVLFGVVAIAWLEATSPVPTCLLSLLFWVFALHIVVLCLTALFDRRTAPLNQATTIVLIFAASTLLGTLVSDEQVIESKLRGDAICAALAEYREDVGRFPGSLLTLTPEYLAEVPDTAVGAILSHGFSYALVDGGYSLRFQQRGGAWWSRDTGGPWRCSDPP